MPNRIPLATAARQVPCCSRTLTRAIEAGCPHDPAKDGRGPRIDLGEYRTWKAGQKEAGRELR